MTPQLLTAAKRLLHSAELMGTNLQGSVTELREAVQDAEQELIRTTSPKPDGGAAFPQPMATAQDGSMYCSSEKHPDFAGMTLRDYFAAHIVAALAANSIYVAYVRGFHKGAGADGGDAPAQGTASMVSEAYRTADAMIAERQK